MTTMYYLAYPPKRMEMRPARFPSVGDMLRANLLPTRRWLGKLVSEGRTIPDISA